jgi:hypothetical protein
MSSTDVPTDASYAINLRSNPPPNDNPITAAAIQLSRMQPDPKGGYSCPHVPALMTHPITPPPRVFETYSEFDNPMGNPPGGTTTSHCLAPTSPVLHFHRNKTCGSYSWHWGRGKLVLMDDKTGEVETMVVGRNKDKGEKGQSRSLDPGMWKASYLLPDDGDVDGAAAAEGAGEGERKGSEKGFCIAEGTIGGCEVLDDDFLTVEGLKALKGEEGSKEWLWLLTKAEREKVGLP